METKSISAIDTLYYQISSDIIGIITYTTPPHILPE